MNNSDPLVSIIILNFNGKHLIEECLNAVFNQSFRDYEIILVDNGSKDGSVELLSEKYSGKIKLITNKTNMGFAAGNNIGVLSSNGKYIALLNNDAIADVRWLEELLTSAEVSDKTVGMWASKILFYGNRTAIDTAGHLIYPDGLNRGRGKGETDRGQYDNKEEIFFPSGCAALYRKDMFDLAGGFDEDFFAYGDDTDIGIKARLLGWKCLYVPAAVVFHKSSATAGTYSPFKAYLVERNRIWILLKYFPVSRIILSLFYTAIRYVLQAYGALSGKGAAGRFVESASKTELIKTLLKAYIDALRKLPVMIKKRSRIMKTKKVTSDEFSLWLKKYRISAKEISLRD